MNEKLGDKYYFHNIRLDKSTYAKIQKIVRDLQTAPEIGWAAAVLLPLKATPDCQAHIGQIRPCSLNQGLYLISSLLRDSKEEGR